MAEITESDVNIFIRRNSQNQKLNKSRELYNPRTGKTESLYVGRGKKQRMRPFFVKMLKKVQEHNPEVFGTMNTNDVASSPVIQKLSDHFIRLLNKGQYIPSNEQLDEIIKVNALGLMDTVPDKLIIPGNTKKKTNTTTMINILNLTAARIKNNPEMTKSIFERTGQLASKLTSSSVNLMESILSSFKTQSENKESTIDKRKQTETTDLIESGPKEKKQKESTVEKKRKEPQTTNLIESGPKEKKQKPLADMSIEEIEDLLNKADEKDSLLRQNLHGLELEEVKTDIQQLNAELEYAKAQENSPEIQTLIETATKKLSGLVSTVKDYLSKKDLETAHATEPLVIDEIVSDREPEVVSAEEVNEVVEESEPEPESHNESRTESSIEEPEGYYHSVVGIKPKGNYESIHPLAVGLWFGSSTSPSFYKSLFQDRNKIINKENVGQFKGILLNQTQKIQVKYSTELSVFELKYDNSSTIQEIIKENHELVQLFMKYQGFKDTDTSGMVGVSLGSLQQFGNLLAGGTTQTKETTQEVINKTNSIELNLQQDHHTYDTISSKEITSLKPKFSFINYEMKKSANPVVKEFKKESFKFNFSRNNR